MGISACLLGQRVRYDGTLQQQLWLEQLQAQIDLQPFCPEVGAGLGVPRPPVRLVSRSGAVRMLGVEHADLDVTEAVQHWIEQQRPALQSLDGFILKARSPSCGHGSSPLFNTAGAIIGKTSGLFATALSLAFPAMQLIEEDALRGKGERLAYIDSLLQMEC